MLNLEALDYNSTPVGSSPVSQEPESEAIMDTDSNKLDS